LVLAAGVPALALAVPVHRVVATAASALLLAGTTWLVLRAVDVAAREMPRRFTGRGNAAATSAVPLARRTAKVVLAVFAVIVALQNFGFNVTGFLAGLGVVGLAAALAAQKTVENFFGGLALITDRPVQVGDFCRFGDRVGTVEDIGLRSTRVRTLDRTVVSVPNGEFSNMQLENFAARDRIWMQTTLGLRYETTPDQLRHVLVELKKVLLAHPKIDPAPARVRFVGFGAYSLDLEVFAYVATSDINEFLAVRQDVYLRFMDVIAASGSGFAFPSQTIYAGTDSGLDAARVRAAEEEVGRWRAEGRLHLPDVPDSVAEALAGSLDYPPKGSPGAR
jgi:MscS family membrane protein